MLATCTTAVLPFGPRAATRFAPNLLASGDGAEIVSVCADVNDDGLVAGRSGAWAVVNAVSLYAERGKDTFQSVHVQAAERVAEEATDEPIPVCRSANEAPEVRPGN